VVSGTPPSITANASLSRYRGRIRAMAAEVCDVTSEGLRTAQLPAAIAPTSGEQTIDSG
jgi:hypothetical protein